MRIAAGEVMRAPDETADGIVRMATALVDAGVPTTVLRTVPLPHFMGEGKACRLSHELRINQTENSAK